MIDRCHICCLNDIVTISMALGFICLDDRDIRHNFKPIMYQCHLFYVTPVLVLDADLGVLTNNSSSPGWIKEYGAV